MFFIGENPVECYGNCDECVLGYECEKLQTAIDAEIDREKDEAVEND